MRVIIAPSAEGTLNGQHSAAIERAEDNVSPDEVVEMFATALVAYGCDEETICAAFETYLSRRLTIQDEDTAHC